MIIGITGGIGGGKSTVSELLRQKGYLVYNSDLVGREIQNNDATVRQKTIELLGPASYDGNTLNRPFVASKVFADSKSLSALNAIVHPAVKDDLRKWIENNNQAAFLFMESAVLFEAGFERIVDKILVVTAPEEVRIDRVMKRDGLSREQVKARMQYQIPDSEKIKTADFIINTTLDESLEQQIDLIFKKLSSF